MKRTKLNHYVLIISIFLTSYKYLIFQVIIVFIFVIKMPP